jgi:hypothetical protein
MRDSSAIPRLQAKSPAFPPTLGSFFLRIEMSLHVRLRMPIFDLWRSWIDASLFAAEAQGVIALRMMRFASGGPHSAAESRRMVTEKFVAFSAAQLAAASSLVRGSSPAEIMRNALAPIKLSVRANHRRLSGARTIS